MNNSALSTPSIAASAMLVDLKVSQWSGRLLDRVASEEVVRGNNAKKGVARVHKDLLSDCEELHAIQKFTTRLRDAHYTMTLPWSDTGLRLLPTAQYFKYTEAMNEMQVEFYRLVDRFINAYQWKISEAQASLGTLFNSAEYPTQDSLRGRFALSITFIPLPEVGDWRVDIGKQGNQQLRDHYAQYYKGALEDAMGDIWKRAHAVLVRMSDRLDYADGQTKKVFRESLVTNVAEIIDIMDACNLTGDQTMSDASIALRRAIQGIDADDLRDDSALRRSVKRDVDAVLATLPSLDF